MTPAELAAELRDAAAELADGRMAFIDPDVLAQAADLIDPEQP